MVMQDLSGIIELLEALSNEGRDDTTALRLLGHEVNRAYVKLAEITESLDESSRKSA